jgi:flagellar protein FliL
MSDEPPKTEEPKKPKGPKVLIALLVLNLGVSGFGTFKIATAPVAEAAPPQHPPPVTNEVVGPVLALDPFVVNLDEPGTSRYLKLTLQFELISHEAEEAIAKNKQLIRDSILSYVSGLHLADTLGAAAKDKLRTEIMQRLEAILGPNKIRRMFFQEFVVQ